MSKPWAAGILLAAFCFCAGVMILLAGPRLAPRLEIKRSLADHVRSVPDLDAYLRESESRFPGIRENQEKTILWAHEDRRKTELSLVYLHGFSSSRGDTSPLMENLARELGANLYLSRLSGHGFGDGDKLAQATPQDWVDDAIEAVAIGNRIGRRTAVVGMSTGANLGLFAALEGGWAGLSIQWLVLLSPNFHVADARARYISGPLGPWLARLALGPERSWTAKTEDHAYFWTRSYPSRAVSNLMDLLNALDPLTDEHSLIADVQGSQFWRPGRVLVGVEGEKEAAPQAPRVLCLYTKNDEVVSVPEIEARCPRLGAETVAMPEATTHELTGRALGLTGNLDSIKGRIRQFLAVAAP